MCRPPRRTGASVRVRRRRAIGYKKFGVPASGAREFVCQRRQVVSSHLQQAGRAASVPQKANFLALARVVLCPVLTRGMTSSQRRLRDYLYTSVDCVGSGARRRFARMAPQQELGLWTEWTLELSLGHLGRHGCYWQNLDCKFRLRPGMPEQLLGRRRFRNGATFLPAQVAFIDAIGV